MIAFRHTYLGAVNTGAVVIVTLRDSQAYVRLLDHRGFSAYRAQHVTYKGVGGLARYSPVRLKVSHTDYWFLVIDVNGHDRPIPWSAIQIERRPEHIPRTVEFAQVKTFRWT